MKFMMILAVKMASMLGTIMRGCDKFCTFALSFQEVENEAEVLKVL